MNLIDKIKHNKDKFMEIQEQLEPMYLENYNQAGHQPHRLYVSPNSSIPLFRIPNVSFDFRIKRKAKEVFTVDGKMIDIAFYDGAKRTLAMAKAAGVYKGDL